MILDMGEPVKIIDLARKMIHLSGLKCQDDTNDEADIRIAFTGLRSGEKLYEELIIGSNVITTSHARIMRSIEHALSWNELAPKIDALELAIQAENNHSIRVLLQEIVPEFSPDVENTDLFLQINELK
jgi:FlaA1/EpsC-like NDP-sugar epimerase